MLKFLNLKTIAVILIVILGISNIQLKKKIDKLDAQLVMSKNNVEQYQSMLSVKDNENRVLLLTIDEFKQSKDSILQQLNKTKESLKIKDKELKRALSNTTLITDTIVKNIPVETNFNVELKPNDLTTIKISRIDSILTCIPEIYNRQDLFILNKKVYRNKYKNWFQRFIHFDFKKDKIEKYEIRNSNDLIQVTDTRIIKLD